MRPDDLKEWLRVLPFRPFRLYVLEVVSFEIRNPNLVIVNRSTLDLYFAPDRPLVPLEERMMTVALLHITRLEVL